MPINPEVMRQVNYDASVGGRNMPKNPLQQAQNFLKNKLFGKPTNPAGMTPQQQTAFDAKQGGKAMRDFAKTKIKSQSTIKQVGAAVKGVAPAAATFATGAAAIGAGAVLGQAARPYVEKLPKASSGRGAGRTTFRDSNNGGRDNANAAGDSTVIETPTQNPERPTTPGNGGAIYGALPPTVNQNLGAYDSSVTLPGMTRGLPADYKKTEQQAGTKAETSRAGAGFGGQTRVSPTGVVQKGTSTSPKPMTMDDANKLLSGGYKVEDPYAGTQLPYTQTSPYAGKGNAEIYNPETLHQHDSDVDYVKLSKDIYEDQSGVELATRNGGMKADYKQMDVNPGEKAPEEKVNWANRTMADNSDEKVRRRSAMLGKAVDADGNPIGIMQRMRNQEAIQGRVYAGGKHYQRNKNAGQEGENDFVEISAGQARARSNYTKTADEVFANHLGRAKETVASSDIPDLPKDAPAPLPDAVPVNTSMDKSPFDTEELMQQKPGKSIIGDNKPYTSANPATLYR